MSASFRRIATVPFTTKRPPASVAGKRAVPAPYLTSATLRCTPLEPADPGGKGEILERLITESTVQLLETYADGALDMRLGDILVVDGRDYPIRGVGAWAWRGSRFHALIVEDLQR
jgi:hypothetical protein